MSYDEDNQQASHTQAQATTMERKSCSIKLREASEIIDRLFSCGVKVLPTHSEPPSPTIVSKKSSYMSRVESLLESQTPEEGAKYLKKTIVDLLHDVEVLKLKLEQSQQESISLKSEIDLSTKKHGERIDALVRTLNAATKGDQQSVFLSREKARALDGEEASLLTIRALTRKIEDLSVKSTQQEREKQQLVESVEDLQCESEAKDVKIRALEAQFKSINRTRQKVVHKLGLSGHDYHEEREQKSLSPRTNFLRLSLPQVSPYS